MANDTRTTGPRDVFLNIFAAISLYMSVFSLGNLIFQYINIYVPDLLVSESARFTREAIRWSLATLVVIFPLYIWVNSYLQKELQKFPEKRELRTRKWLLYFTLFLASGFIAGDLIALIFRYLSGELTIRFLLKVVSILLIAISVFLYYGWILRKEIPPTQDPRMKFFARGATAIVFALIVAGFFFAGSPQAERLRRFDDRRVSDLQQIQFQIVEFWRAKKRLPDSLNDLRDEISGFIPQKDPETGESYEYRKKSDLSFELCANFKASGEREKMGMPRPVLPEGWGAGETWRHEAGYQCFSRTIDPELYPPLEKRP